ncbi:MAG: GatB/YqeY domain-containing protein, partial [Bacteroidales bacterium]|nr:GatB/YqeY domain-containing protein [Candidatus Sodaliphilus aphodohippi]
MAIFDNVSAGIKAAMLARDKVRLGALQGIKAELLLIKTQPGNNGEVSDENALKALVRMVKQRKESAAIYAEKKRQDLADEELAQAAVIEEFLPKQMTDEELTAAIQDIIKSTGASSMKDMGKVMGIATKQLAGRAEGKVISTKVRELLA